MKTYYSLLLLIALVFFGVSQTGCSSEAQSKEPEEEEEVPAIPVEATTISTGDIAAFFTGTASLEAEEEALVVAKSGGIVMEIFAEEGDYVKAGDPLAKLDDERLALELSRAETNLAKLQRVYERNEELYQKSLIAAEEYERVKSEYEAQKTARDIAKLDLEYATVRAPFTGVVSERFIKVGNMVRLNEGTFHLTDFDPLLAVMHVPERELNKLRKGQTAELYLDALNGEVFKGYIKRISPIVDPATGTFKVTIEVRDSSGRIKPGMFGRVSIVYDTHKDVLLVPKEAVLAEDDESAVYVVRDSMAFRLPVMTGYTDERFVEVVSGVDAGEIIITTGQNSLRDSSKVEVIN